MLKKILVGLVVIVAVFGTIVAFQPSDYRVARSAIISAPARAVFAWVNDFQQWERWSPWAKLDPAVRNTFEGPSAGTGAVFAWAGNSKVGEGRMTLTESRPSELVRIKLEFIKPFASTCLTEFNFKPEGQQTIVTWSMSGHNNFLEKAFCLVMNMDKTVGGDFEKGLALMKSVAESSAGQSRGN